MWVYFKHSLKRRVCNFPSDYKLTFKKKQGMQHFCVVAADNYHGVSGAGYNPGILRNMADYSALRGTQFGNFALLGKWELFCFTSSPIL